MSLWWLQPGWTETCCANCGAKIWPQGDPDWGMCEPCFTQNLQYEQDMRQYDDDQRLNKDRRHPKITIDK